MDKIEYQQYLVNGIHESLYGNSLTWKLKKLDLENFGGNPHISLLLSDKLSRVLPVHIFQKPWVKITSRSGGTTPRMRSQVRHRSTFGNCYERLSLSGTGVRHREGLSNLCIFVLICLSKIIGTKMDASKVTIPLNPNSRP